MKIRNGFVSNSSSSSFAIKLNRLNRHQIEQIHNHIYYARRASTRIGVEVDESEESIGRFGWAEPWRIEEIGDEIVGTTNMDNFSMSTFLKYIGVPTYDIEWREY